MSNEQEPTDLDWIQLRKDMGNVQQVETTKEKFTRKFLENPFVPLGMILNKIIHILYVECSIFLNFYIAQYFCVLG